MTNYKELLNKLLLLDENLPIYISGHITPDQDSIGSSLSLARFLNRLGKKAIVLLRKEDYPLIRWQGDYSLIQNKISCKNYNFIALDLNQLLRLGDFEEDFTNACYSINIDHHSGNTVKANYVFSIPEISSTCEIIYEVISLYNKNMLDNATCENLYAGIMTDTNCFSRRISSRTLIIAQELINTGIDYENINKKTLWRRTSEELIAVGELSKQIKSEKYFHYLIVDETKKPFNSLSYSSLTKKVAEDLRKREDLDIFIMLVIRDNNEIWAKVMSNLCNKASKIAEFMGGGGHPKEAGFKTNLSVDEILTTLRNNESLFI